MAAVLTGLFTGLFVASAEEFFSRDGVLGGAEALATFVPLPLLAALLVSIGLRRHRLALRITGRTLDLIAVRRMAVVAYLTLFIPLLSIGFAGDNDVRQWMLGGAIGGGFWGLLFTIDLSRAGPISK